jgi:tetratricopeptide (TPR) repeat protein
MVSPAFISHASSAAASATALDFSARACDCLQEGNLTGALLWYQRALVLYQQAQPLGVVDTCNAAATLHNMGAVYKALKDAEQALTCYYDAEQLNRE